MDPRLPSGLDGIRDPLVRSAVEAVNSRDRKRWFGLFVEKPSFSDDGVEQDLERWCDEELFGRHSAHIVAIDKVEDGGLTFYAQYHSDKWGDFQTFWRFAVRDGKVSRLDVGATSY